MKATQNRLDRERHTIQVMIELRCRQQHHPSGSLCAECQALLTYAMQRIDKCPYHMNKPTCAQCPIHCYRPDMREQVRQVMRYAGPRMIFHHPVLALLHLWDQLTRSRELRSSKRRGED